jgi:hypothetical protein
MKAGEDHSSILFTANAGSTEGFSAGNDGECSDSGVAIFTAAGSESSAG